MAESYQFAFIFLLIFTTAVELFLGQRQKNFVVKNKKRYQLRSIKLLN